MDIMLYVPAKKEEVSNLKKLRVAAGISQRELARRIGEQHTNVQYWENNKVCPRADLLVPIANALGTTVDELLGQPAPKKPPRIGKMRQLFEAASKLPRSQQDKIIAILEPFVKEHLNDNV